MKNFRKLLSVFITFQLIIWVFNINTLSLEKTTITSTEQIIDASQVNFAELPQYIKESIDVKETEVLSIESKGSEDLNSIIINNSDGTKTQYTYDIPIKYIENNKVMFKETKLEKRDLTKRIFSEYEYENTKNNVKSYYPKDINDGILMEYLDYSVNIKPKSSFSKASSDIKVDSKNTSAKYSNVFSSADYIEYMPTVSGVEENIILKEYSGVNTFKFTVDIENLTPAFLLGESIPLLDSETKELVMSIGHVDARDSYVGENENNDTHFTLYNSLKLEKTDTPNEYILTITVDKEFLQSPTTVYPVVIDPTLTVANGSNIIDTTVYSGDPYGQTYYTSSYCVVGNHGSAYGEGVALMKLTTLQNYVHINPNNITAATYRVREGSGKTNSSVIEVHDVYGFWEQETVTYYDMPETYSYPSGNNLTVTTSAWYDFNIKDLLKQWLRAETTDGGFSQQSGFALRAQDPNASSKHFCSSEHSNYLPSVSVTYSEDVSLPNGTYYIRNKAFNKYLNALEPDYGYTTGRADVKSSITDVSQQWVVNRNDDGTYSLYPLSRQNNYLEVLTQANTEGRPVITNLHTDISSAIKWRIVKSIDNSYRIMPVFSYTRSLSVYDGEDGYMVCDGRNFTKLYGIDVEIATYTGNSNRRWYFEKVEFGAGGEYRQVNDTSINCFEYALFIEGGTDGLDLLGVGNTHQTENFSNLIIEQLANEYQITCERIDSFADTIFANQYRIAVRVPNLEENKYHFIYQLSDGRWAGKDDQAPSVNLGFGNPSTSPHMWSNDAYPASCGTIYFAVDRTW